MNTSNPDPRKTPPVVLAPLAVDVVCDASSLRITLVDGRELAVSLPWFPRLVAATPEERSRWQLIGEGEGIHWPEIDEDISVASLLGLPSD